MTRAQRNDIFRSIVEGGIDPAACELRGVDEQMLIEHPSSGSWIRISSQTSRSFTGYVKFGDDPARGFFGNANWSDVVNHVGEWCQGVVEYVNTPDLWAELEHTRDVLKGSQYEAVENTPFTPAEQAEISNQLRAIKASLQENFELTAEKLSQVGERLDEVEEASHRLGRKDWILLFAGTVFTLIITGTVTPDVAQHILTMALHGLSHLFLGGMKPISAQRVK